MTPSPYILLVDDDPQVLKYLQRALKQNGYAVTATTSGREALIFTEENLPDLMILDLNMPAPDGFDLLKAERSKFRNLRILTISGYLQGALLEAAKIFGAVATIEKPVSARALTAKVREILGR